MKGEYQGAVEATDRALAVDPGHAVALATRGAALVALDRYEEALEVLDRALSSQPDHAFALIAKADALQWLDRHTEGLEAVDRALTLDATSLWGHGTRALILIGVADNAGAEAAVAAAGPTGADSAWLQWLLGLAILNEGRDRVDEARRVLERAHELEPNDTSITTTLGDARLLAGLRDKAEAAWAEAAERAEASSAADWSTLWTLGWCRYRLGEPDRAARLLTKALASDPGRVSLQFDLALSLLVAGHGQAALPEYERGIALAETRKDRLRRRGLLVLARGDLEESRDLDTAVRESAEAQIALDRLGSALAVVEMAPVA
jgi:tetratricopeptide (TPR) repeat protein